MIQKLKLLLLFFILQLFFIHILNKNKNYINCKQNLHISSFCRHYTKFFLQKIHFFKLRKVIPFYLQNKKRLLKLKNRLLAKRNQWLLQLFLLWLHVSMLSSHSIFSMIFHILATFLDLLSPFIVFLIQYLLLSNPHIQTFINYSNIKIFP